MSTLWVSYSGDARILLAVGLAVVAGGLAYLGVRLPLPVRATRPGKKATVVIIVAWVTALLPFAAAAGIYLWKYLHGYRLTGMPADHVAPVTFTAVAAVFVIILTRSPGGFRTRLASAAIAAMVAPMIFEFPFDLIIMERVWVYLPLPAWYWALTFVPLFTIEFTTLLLLRLSPAVRVTRATFITFALMIGVFAVWALAGFGYPSTPVPFALNVVSKLLAFAVVLTLFFPRQGPAPADAAAVREQAATVKRAGAVPAGRSA